MNKVIVIMLSIIVVIGAIITGMLIFNNNVEQDGSMSNIKVSEEEILDDCTDEYEELNSEQILQTDSNEEKISPNCAMILKSYYLECKHTIRKYSN